MVNLIDLAHRLKIKIMNFNNIWSTTCTLNLQRCLQVLHGHSFTKSWKMLTQSLLNLEYPLKSTPKRCMVVKTSSLPHTQTNDSNELLISIYLSAWKLINLLQSLTKGEPLLWHLFFRRRRTASLRLGKSASSVWESRASFRDPLQRADAAPSA